LEYALRPHLLVVSHPLVREAHVVRDDEDFSGFGHLLNVRRMLAC
jgi:hypothetical protein